MLLVVLAVVSVASATTYRVDMAADMVQRIDTVGDGSRRYVFTYSKISGKVGKVREGEEFDPFDAVELSHACRGTRCLAATAEEAAAIKSVFDAHGEPYVEEIINPTVEERAAIENAQPANRGQIHKALLDASQG